VLDYSPNSVILLNVEVVTADVILEKVVDIGDILLLLDVV
jgi:hypothetical protein